LGAAPAPGEIPGGAWVRRETLLSIWGRDDWRNDESVNLGAFAFVAQIICGLFATVSLLDETVMWIGLALAFNAAGNLSGGVRTAQQRPLGE
jgi:hypothetical protein